MDELVKALRHFITRDLVFVVSGSAVIGALLYRFERLPRLEDSWLIFGLLAGVGYFVGYALQDGLSLTPLVTTAYVQRPNRFVQWLYRRFTRTEWRQIHTIDLVRARERITDEKTLARLERIITLKQVGTAGGPSVAVCAVLFLSNWWASGAVFDLAVATAGAILGPVLICLGWLKGAQQAEFVARHGAPEAPAASQGAGL